MHSVNIFSFTICVYDMPTNNHSDWIFNHNVKKTYVVRNQHKVIQIYDSTYVKYFLR